MKILEINPNIEISTNIAIVGSSGNLLNGNYGVEIDSFEDVVRFNRAPVDGYQRHVGSKTTIRVANNNVIMAQPIPYTCQPTNFIRSLKNSRILYYGPRLIKYKDKDKFIDKDSEFFIFDYLQIDKIKTVSGFSGDLPSCGLIMICICIAYGIVPVLYGFDVDINMEPRTHYWEQRGPAGPYHNVNYEKEFIINKAAHNKIIIRPLC